MKKLFILSFAMLMLMFSGCGEGSNNAVNGGSNDQAIQMEVGVTYTVVTGDKVVPDGTATIYVEHILDAETKNVKITSGSAVLLRGAYAL